MPIEIESPEELGYGAIDCNLAESSFRDQRLADLDVAVDVDELLLAYGDHLGDPDLRRAVADQAGVAPRRGDRDPRGGRRPVPHRDLAAGAR